MRRFVCTPHRVTRQFDALHGSAHDASAIRAAVIVAAAVTIDRTRSDDDRRWRIRAVVVGIVDIVVTDRIVERIESDEEAEAETEWIPEAVGHEERIAPTAEPHPISAVERHNAVDAAASEESRAAVKTAERSAAAAAEGAPARRPPATPRRRDRPRRRPARPKRA